MSKAAGAASGGTPLRCAWASLALRRLAWTSLSLAPALAGAASTELADVTITATRIERAAFEVPASITRSEIRRDTLGVNLAESLNGVAGLLARDRQNYAQDTQIAVRGFGARSTFGIRGVRLYIDGVPATQPDGQGQVSHFNLATAERVEVLRGPFSALYGNSSGGVIQLFTADGAGTPSARAGLTVGSAATTQATLSSQGEMGRWQYNAGYLRFRTDGTRGHSAAQRDSIQFKLGTEVGTHDHVTVLYNELRAPDVDDPLGLTRAQLDANPDQTAPTSLQFNTRKSARQRLAGITYDAVRDQQRWRAMAYGGTRQIEQYLAVPAIAQLDARSGGGVVDLESRFQGGELRWTQSGLVVGVSFDTLTQQRRGYENTIGSVLGVRGNLRRDERNEVSAFDQYLQYSQPLGSRWSLDAGLRHSSVRVESRDFYLRPGNGDDSGRVSYSATTPVAALLWRWTPTMNLYASYGKGFETPTLVELAYRADGSTGLNLALRPASSRNLELGWKWRPEIATSVDAAVFRADTSNELSVVSNIGGRAAYGNIGTTRRAGLEVGARHTLGPRLQLEGAGTLLQARLPGGNYVPGVPEAYVYLGAHGALAGDVEYRVEGRYVSRVAANDANTEVAAGYATFDASVGRAWQRDEWRLRATLRLENLLDHRHVGSVIVNEANGRYFEPAAGRTLMLGLAMAWR